MELKMNKNLKMIIIIVLIVLSLIYFGAKKTTQPNQVLFTERKAVNSITFSSFLNEMACSSQPYMYDGASSYKIDVYSLNESYVWVLVDTFNCLSTQRLITGSNTNDASYCTSVNKGSLISTPYTFGTSTANNINECESNMPYQTAIGYCKTYFTDHNITIDFNTISHGVKFDIILNCRLSQSSQPSFLYNIDVDECISTEWLPLMSEVPLGEEFIQTSNCNLTRVAVGSFVPDCNTLRTSALTSLSAFASNPTTINRQAALSSIQSWASVC
jgi:hypothetical protein